MTKKSILRHRVISPSHHLFIKLIALCLIITLPLWVILAFKWPISSDLIFYATSAKAFSEQLWAGDVYPRWLMNTNVGFGSPVFLFYSPLVFYVMSFFEFIAPIDPHGYGRIMIGIMLAIPVAGLTSYRWLKQQLPLVTAEKGALLYAGFPYLLLPIYGGFAVAQLWGVALLPFLLEAAGDVAQKGWRAIPKLALAYAMLCFTHLPSVITFAAVPCLYAVVFALKGQRIRVAVSVVISTVLGVALSMVCLLPALSNKPYITSEHFLDGNLIYSHNFLDNWSLLGVVSVVMPLLVLFMEIPKRNRRAHLTGPICFWLLIEVGLLCMALPLSKPLWDVLPPLQHLQFPFRFFLAMLPGAVFIAMHWLSQAKSDYAYHLLFAIGLVCAVIYSEEINFFARESPSKIILDNNLLARPEYQTRWMEAQHVNFRVSVPERFKEMQPTTFLIGAGSASITSQDSRTIVLHANVTSPEAIIALKRFYFPGWVALPTGSMIEEHDSLLSVHVQHGSHDVTLSLPWFAGEREGVLVSLCAGMLTLVLYVVAGYRPKQ